jgi:Down syndrome cell adhesion molecule
METYLHALSKATNYSIRVLAYTSTGDGQTSLPIHCSTDEDVPEAPANIKASALTADSILVSWLPPIQRNGHITQYNIYSKEHGRKGQTKSKFFNFIFILFIQNFNSILNFKNIKQILYDVMNEDIL